MSFYTDRQAIEAAYRRMYESAATDNYDALDKEYKRIDADLAKARLWGEREEVDALKAKLSELKTKMQTAKSMVDDENRKAEADRIEQNKKDQMVSDAEMQRRMYKAAMDRNGGSSYDKFVNGGGNLSFAGKEAANAAMDKYIDMRNSGYGVNYTDKYGRRNINHDALSSAKQKVQDGNYTGALDDVVKDYSDQFGLNYNNATNNVSYRNMKKNLSDGRLPTTSDIYNAMGAMNVSGSR